MKQIRNIAFSALLTIGAFTAITYTSCSKDECKNVVCQNGGTCLNGACVCASGYEGTNCETASATALKGQYTSTETCQPPTSGNNSWSSTVTVSSTDATKIVISNFGDSGSNIVGHVSKNAITLDATTVGNSTISGTGTVSGTTLTMNYNIAGPTNRSCTMTMVLQ